MTSDNITIIRADHNASERWFITLREAAQDTRLSFDTRGVLWYLLSKPDDWQVRQADIQREGNFGRERARRILDELIDAGYLARPQKFRKQDGTWGYTPYKLHEQPMTANPTTAEPTTGQPLTGEPLTGEPATANPTTYKEQTQQNTDSQNTDSKTTDSMSVGSEPRKVFGRNSQDGRAGQGDAQKDTPPSSEAPPPVKAQIFRIWESIKRGHNITPSDRDSINAAIEEKGETDVLNAVQQAQANYQKSSIPIATWSYVNVILNNIPAATVPPKPIVPQGTQVKVATGIPTFGSTPEFRNRRPQ